jgi:hypothetical protein
MPASNVPLDAPPGVRHLLGGTSWLTDRRYFLADDGTVWCREAGYAGFATPRWRRVPVEEQDSIMLRGWTLAQVAATLMTPPEDVPTDRGWQKRQTPVSPG